jgi:hypothetical protein
MISKIWVADWVTFLVKMIDTNGLLCRFISTITAACSGAIPGWSLLGRRSQKLQAAVKVNGNDPGINCEPGRDASPCQGGLEVLFPLRRALPGQPFRKG